jgi:hypothetical protein
MPDYAADIPIAVHPDILREMLQEAGLSQSLPGIWAPTWPASTKSAGTAFRPTGNPEYG